MKDRTILCTRQHTGGKGSRRLLAAAVAALLALGLPGVAQAQEMIRAIYEAPTTFSLARSYSSYKKWIVYNEYSDFSLFGMMDTSGYGNIFLKTRQQIHVNDMEITGNTLYFCGSMYNYELMKNVGVMGFFPISQMYNPSTMTISYIFFNEFSELRKMVVYDRDSTRHVPMVGTGLDGRDYIADAYLYYGSTFPFGGSWNRAWLYLPNIDAQFDDIASYKDSIAVSSRVENATEVQIGFIGKTPLVGLPFFATSPVDMTKVPDAPTGRVLLQTADVELYAFYRHGPYLDVCRFQGRSNYRSFHIPILSTGGFFPETFTLKDVCVDKRAQDEMSVLLRKTYTITIDYQILHIPVSLFPLGGIVSGHEYPQASSYTPYSLCGGRDYHTVTMGKYMDYWGMARVVNPLFENCTLELEKKKVYKKPGIEPVRRYHEMVDVGGVVLEMPVESVDYVVWQECGNYYIKNEGENK